MNYYSCIKNCPIAKKNICTGNIQSQINMLSIDTIEGGDLYYAPVGNAIKSPQVIICGQTPDYNTAKQFWNLISNGKTMEYAGMQTVYSNKTMRKNLFTALSIIDFFEYMKLSNSYWSNEDISSVWQNSFLYNENSSKSDIQYTQSCNCAIIRGNSSKQPKKAIISEINNRAPECLFNSFQISDNLKLIIFLDSPSKDNRYHQIDFFEKNTNYGKCINNGVRIISIPHPSGSNRVYNELETLQNNKYIIHAKKVINELINKRKEEINND